LSLIKLVIRMRQTITRLASLVPTVGLLGTPRLFRITLLATSDSWRPLHFTRIFIETMLGVFLGDDSVYEDIPGGTETFRFAPPPILYPSIVGENNKTCNFVFLKANITPVIS
jgi:hypothetical protein